MRHHNTLRGEALVALSNASAGSPSPSLAEFSAPPSVGASPAPGHSVDMSLASSTSKLQRSTSFFRPTTVSPLRVVALCASWYIFSALANNISKTILNEYPFPLTVTFAQLFSIAFYQWLMIVPLGWHPYQRLTARELWRCVLPLALGKVLASASASISISKVPISYAHTVKAVAPLFTIILSTFVLREKHSWRVYLSLVPIMGGVLLATVTEMSFHLIGLISSLFSCLIFTMQNIYSKKMMKENMFDHMNLLYHTSRAACLMFLPMWLLSDAMPIFYMFFPAEETANTPSFAWFIFKLALDGFCNYYQNVTAITFLFMVSPVSYSVANTTKRVVVIVAGLLTFHNPVNFLNGLGMTTAVVGVAIYNAVKLAEGKTHVALPLTSKFKESSEHLY